MFFFFGDWVLLVAAAADFSPWLHSLVRLCISPVRVSSGPDLCSPVVIGLVSGFGCRISFVALVLLELVGRMRALCAIRGG